MESELLRGLLANGVMGLVSAGCLYAAISLYRELRAEKAARLADAKASTEALLAMQGRVHDTIERIDGLMDRVENRRGRP